MLIGHVSDERYVALPDVTVTLERDGHHRVSTRSTPHGGVYANVEPGTYRVTLEKDGYGKKCVSTSVGESQLTQFRLLSSDPLGYAWPMWTTTDGETAVHVHAATDATVELWRYGYDKEFVRAVDCDPVRQEIPDGDFASGGVEWDASGWVQAPDRSGLYYFHLETTSGEFFSFPWIVAPAAPSANVAVLASTNTWNAYNEFGGRSNYVTPAGLEPVPWVEYEAMTARERRWYHPNDAYEPLSFERPSDVVSLPPGEAVTDPYDDGGERHTAGAEWRLLGWLEREEYEHEVYADQQLHDGTLDLGAYDVLVVHTHPEYWSHEMYRRVKAWVFERGGSLAYLGGNGINAEVEFLDPSRIRIRNSLRNVAYDAFHHDDVPEGTYESRFHRSAVAEGELLGSVYTAHGIQTAAPYTVLDDSHWVFGRTGLERGDSFGERTLQRTLDQGASGHETDKLSKHAPANTRLLAKGNNPADSGAEMVYHEPNDGAVFSAGSITYPSALLVDDNVSTITATVLDRFLDHDSRDQ